MLKEEAKWIENELERLSQQGTVFFPLANIGCSDEKQLEFQPWVRDLIGHIQKKGTLVNIDIKDSPGVDMVGDLLDPLFITQLKERKFGALLCANILTNITDKEKFAASIIDVIPPGSVLIVTVSNRYPYVADPVDTLYRPTPDQLKMLFPGTEIVSSALVESQSYIKLLWSKKRIFLVTVVRLFMPFYKFKTWLNLVNYLPQIFKPVRSSCLVLKKI
jgi:hypothetical protein